MLIAQLVIEMEGFIAHSYKTFEFSQAPIECAKHFASNGGLCTDYQYWLVCRDTEENDVIGQYRILGGSQARALFFDACVMPVVIKDEDGFQWIEAYDFPGVVFIRHNEMYFAFLSGYEVTAGELSGW